ncbi:hypothetical protein NC997_19850 [Trichocoleus sp. DQ-A2]|uniref:hypothetical protein n=1 Tax=Cyanophyceae TaxID=3028117 RepID=UPI00168227CD|nr:hypothetical protein [Coleofasciculus sp. FACHB-712]MBD1878163.1 hypothetical protein [Coleofasciculus sp. FACHB-T130]MBD1942700.1 hypothetical protein [Coleofasciculus sp. FACHB-712]
MNDTPRVRFYKTALSILKDELRCFCSELAVVTFKGTLSRTLAAVNASRDFRLRSQAWLV